MEADMLGVASDLNISLKSAAKRLTKRAAIQSGLEAVALLSRVPVIAPIVSKGIIFVLHHVRPERSHTFDPNGLLSVTPEFLEQAINVSMESGLTPVRLHSLPHHLQQSRDTEKFVCFTLDDGYRDNVEFAAPVFRKFRVPYTIFVTTGFVDRVRTIWWETAEVLTRLLPRCELTLGSETVTLEMDTRRKKLVAFERIAEIVRTLDEDEAIRIIDQTARANGIDPNAIVDDLILNRDELHELTKDPLASIGAHTVTHVNLRRVDPERLTAEMQASARAVEQYTGRYPMSFAYPYGRHYAVTSREISATREVGFSIAVTTQPAMLSAESLGRLYSLNRVSLNGNYQKRRYVKALISGIPFALGPKNFS